MSSEAIFFILKGLVDKISDKDAVSVRELRERATSVLGLPSDGLDDKKDDIRRWLQSILADEPFPDWEGDSGAMPARYNEALQATTGWRLTKAPRAYFSPYKVPSIDFKDLPIREYFGVNPIKAVVDVIIGHDERFDEEVIKRNVVDGEMDALPAICQPPVGAAVINHFSQTAFVKRSDGKYDIVRFITFQTGATGGKAMGPAAVTHKHGELYIINYGANKHNGKRVFQYLFQRLGGFQIRHWKFEGAEDNRFAAASDDMDVAAIDRGFDFIENAWRKREVPPTGFGQLRWITRCIKDPACPLHNWASGLIEKSFRELRDEGSLAKVVVDCPYTIKSFQPWFVDEVLADLCHLLSIKSLGMVGTAGCGKSPVLEGIACMFSRFWKRKLNIQELTSYRAACDLDFFRGQVGTVDRPDLLDDSDAKYITPAKWKAFSDVGLAEAMSRERWGASNWVRNQLTSNPILPAVKSEQKPVVKSELGREQQQAKDEKLRQELADLDRQRALRAQLQEAERELESISTTVFVMSDSDCE